VNPNDEVRQRILSYFYARNTNATSRMGKKGSAVRISNVKHDLKELHGLTQKQVMSNLTYLTDMGWVKTFEVEKQVATSSGTTVPSSVTWYEIAASGIEKIEGASEFTPAPAFAGVNITALGANVITMGDGNVVHAEFRELHAELDQVRGELVASDVLDDAQKLEVIADIESLKSQLAKSDPDGSVIAALWSGIDKAAALAGLAQLAVAVYPHVQRLIG